MQHVSDLHPKFALRPHHVADIQSATAEIIMMIIIIIIQYLYSALKSCKGYRGAGGFRLRLLDQVVQVYYDVVSVDDGDAATALDSRRPA